VRQILHDLAHQMGKTVVAVTHDAAFAAAADRRIGIVDGKIDADWRAV
jgi:lipoprotein-releasing system ATP-binding protein